jgi:uncharacterized protein YcfL
MKKITLLALLSAFILLGAGCQSQTQTVLENLKQDVTETTESLPPAVEELQTQTVPENQKQDVSKTTTKTEPAPVEVTIYRGSWFDIKYPQNFTARPTGPTTVNNGNSFIQTDEAYFESPDRSVEFFVYSPLWAGNPKNYLEITKTEELVDEKTEKSKALPGQLQDTERVIRWVTVRAKDGSYYRSFVSIREQVAQGHSELHHVFGIKYKDNTGYERYKDAYIAFKESLRQYAD